MFQEVKVHIIERKDNDRSRVPTGASTRPCLQTSFLLHPAAKHLIQNDSSKLEVAFNVNVPARTDFKKNSQAPSSTLSLFKQVHSFVQGTRTNGRLSELVEPVICSEKIID